MDELAHRRLFEALDDDKDGRLWTWQLLAPLGQSGITPGDPLTGIPGDPRLRAALAGLRDPGGSRLGLASQPPQLDYQQFSEIARHGDGIVERALADELAVSRSEFLDLARGVQRIYADLLPNTDGQVAQYIPTLKNADPDRFGIAICTADGQVFEIGDTRLPFSVQSTSKPFSYAMALEQLGADTVHEYVGQEQSGGTFNDYKLSLDADRRPLNPMINAGAIATLALVDAGRNDSDRIGTVKQTWAAMTGQELDPHAETFLAERETGNGNRALAYLMAAEERLKAQSPEQAAEFYFQVCSLGVNATQLAASGATLANGGVAPYSGARVFSPENTGRVLSVMGHSGMYNDSGKFADQVGLPAKSGVSGNVMMVVPSKRFAVVTFSPRLDAAGNSVRGVEVCRRLVDEFGLHPYKGLSAEQSRAQAAHQPAAARRLALDGTASSAGTAAASAQAATDSGRTMTFTFDRKQSQGNQL